MVDDFIFNEDIKGNMVRLKEKKDTIGIMTLSQAKEIANEKNMDLVLMTDKADPIVVELCNKNKFLYEHKKKQQLQKKKQQTMELQEIQLSINIHENDIDHKVETIKKIFQKGNKIKLSVKLRKKFASKTEEAKLIIQKAINKLTNICKIEKDIHCEERHVWAICIPIKQN